MKIAINCMWINGKNHKNVRVLISQSDYKESDRISSGLIAKTKFHTATGLLVRQALLVMKKIVLCILVVDRDGSISPVHKMFTNASRVK